MSDSHSATPPANPSTPAHLNSPGPPVRRIRLLVLLGLLVVMVGALWYDYKIARPAVVNAYERIGKLNSTINGRGGKQFMTNKDVQTELNRTPIESFTEGGYMVEVYGWRSGLPTKRHKYYAVYTEDAPYIFLKHYMNVIDRDELKRLPILSEPGVSGEPTEIAATGTSATEPGAGADKKKGKRKKEGSSAESSAPGDSAKEIVAAPADSNANRAKEPAAVAGEANPAKEKSATENAQPKG